MQKPSKSDIGLTGLSVGFALATYVGAASLGLLVVLSLGFGVIAAVLMAAAVELLIE